ncbi:MAG: SPASM domain-containing protein [Nitrospirae bacterium]|nr:SPASM domain-containing protein [Nitrospirota bacterium]MBF0536431.1 SPASM domain-containing protein [Nitrospirota bacterium]MBF0618358.1 SPASM domain-containing protein [Nitrospirota bacterium]
MMKGRLLFLLNQFGIPHNVQKFLYAKYLKLYNLFKYGDPNFIRSLTIETSTYCNRKCYYCPNSLETVPELFMTEECFKLVVERLCEINFTGTINFAFYNEPLLDRRLPFFVSFLKSKRPGCLVFINTNGDYLTAELAEILIKSGVNLFLVTNHDIDGSSYMNAKRELFEKYSSHIKLQNIHEDALLNRGGIINVKRNVMVEERKSICDEMCDMPIIDYTGNVLLCCNDYHRKHVIGNIYQNSLYKIWKHEPYKTIRNKLRRGIADLEICKKCMNIG